MQKQMVEIKAGDVIVVKGARLLVESVEVGNPFIHLNIAHCSQSIFGKPEWYVEVVDDERVKYVPAKELRTGDVTTIANEKIVVKATRALGSMVRVTAYGHPASDCWWVHKNCLVGLEPLTFTVQGSEYVQMPLLEVASG